MFFPPKNKERFLIKSSKNKSKKLFPKQIFLCILNYRTRYQNEKNTIHAFNFNLMFCLVFMKFGPGSWFFLPGVLDVIREPRQINNSFYCYPDWSWIVVLHNFPLLFNLLWFLCWFRILDIAPRYFDLENFPQCEAKRVLEKLYKKREREREESKN